MGQLWPSLRIVDEWYKYLNRKENRCGIPEKMIKLVVSIEEGVLKGVRGCEIAFQVEVKTD